MQEKLQNLKQKALEEIQKAENLEQLKKLETKYLGRKSEFTQILRSVGELPKEERPLIGKLANEIKNEITNEVESKKLELEDKGGVQIDVTVPGKEIPQGHTHITTQAIEEISDIFKRIGFYRVRYPEVEWDWYGFGSLNFPDDHPARDEWETYFIDNEEIDPKYGKRILTPHTSSGQVREMESGRMPIRMINISKCYRRQADASHVSMFHQFEGLMVDEGITIAHLKGVLDFFVKQFLGEDREVRIRPYDFRFTEPSFEVDVSCGVCKGEGCKLCKEGWLEIGGSGMVHPNVLEAGGIDPDKYSGFAFGWGVERCMMMKPGMNIPDMRLLYQNDVRFLSQF